MIYTHESQSEDDTFQIAHALASGLPRRAVVLLVGDLGAGKTAFVRGLVEGAGGRADDVSSPTFVLIQEYGGPRPVAHVDLYRLRRPEVEALEEEIADLRARDGIVAIEWADRLTRPITGAVHVHIDDRGGDARTICIDAERTMSGRADPDREPR